MGFVVTSPQTSHLNSCSVVMAQFLIFQWFITPLAIVQRLMPRSLVFRLVAQLSRHGAQPRHELPWSPFMIAYRLNANLCKRIMNQTLEFLNPSQAPEVFLVAASNTSFIPAPRFLPLPTLPRANRRCSRVLGEPGGAPTCEPEAPGRGSRALRHPIRRMTRATIFYRNLLHLRYIRSGTFTN